MKTGDLVVINKNCNSSSIWGECGVVLETDRKIVYEPLHGPSDVVDVAMVLINGIQRVLCFEDLSEVLGETLHESR